MSRVSLERFYVKTHTGETILGITYEYARGRLGSESTRLGVSDTVGGGSRGKCPWDPRPVRYAGRPRSGPVHGRGEVRRRGRPTRSCL